MGRLSTALAAPALAPLRWLKPRAVNEWSLGGVARAASDPLPQAGQFAGKGGELAAELIICLSESLNLLLFSEDKLSALEGVASQSGSSIKERIRHSAICYVWGTLRVHERSSISLKSAAYPSRYAKGFLNIAPTNYIRGPRIHGDGLRL